MIQNLSHKHALLNTFAEILPRGSVLLCFTRLTHTAINFPQRQIFGVLTSIYWTLTEVAWDGAIYWRSYLPQCSTCQDQVEGIDERMMSGRRRKMSFFVCCGFSTSSSTDGTSYVLRFLNRVNSWPTNFVIRKTSAPPCNINSLLFRGNALFRCWPTKVTTFSELHKCQHSNAWVTTIPKSRLCPQNESTKFF